MIEVIEDADGEQRAIERPGERWERQFCIVASEVSGVTVFEDFGPHYAGDQPIASFSSEEEAERFIQAVQFGQRRGHRTEESFVIECDAPPYSTAVASKRLEREYAEREVKRDLARHKRQARAARKAAAAAAMTEDDTVAID